MEQVYAHAQIKGTSATDSTGALPATQDQDAGCGQLDEETRVAWSGKAIPGPKQGAIAFHRLIPLPRSTIGR